MRDYIILDLRRVQSVDITAAHMLNQVRDMLMERGQAVKGLISSAIRSVSSRIGRIFRKREEM